MNGDSQSLDERIKLNIGGTLFVTTKKTLSKYPGTRLAKLTTLSSSFDPTTGEHFFDRNPIAFACILEWYRISELHLPTNLCGSVVRTELSFWKIPEVEVSECCTKLFDETDRGRAVINVLHNTLQDEDLGPGPSAPHWKIWQHRLWLFLDRPNSSRAAKAWSIIFMIIIALSALTYCVETLSALRVPNALYSMNRDIISENLIEEIAKRKENEKFIKYIKTDPHPALLYVDHVLLCVFTIELILHFLSCPGKRNFFKRFLNWIDIITVFTAWSVDFMILGFSARLFSLSVNSYTIFLLLKSVYILRLFRFFRMAERFTGLKVLMLAIKGSLSELALLMFAIVILATMLGSFAFYCEFENNEFSDIPVSIWWALVTMTTVGYGDYFPVSFQGRAVGAVCALCGVLSLALPIAVIASNFNEYYSRNRCREKILQQKVMRRQFINTWDSK